MTPSTETRRLAAVMFADIEGYTALFQRNEPAAMKQVEAHRKDLEEVTRKHKGKIIQFYGDGSVTIYNSVIEAINSAIEIQHLSSNQQIPLRIGIHMGDLVFKKDDIFGDVVNVTSRIQSIGIPGSIIVSKKVADELKNHPEIQFYPLGKYALKNVQEELELFAVTGYGLNVPDKKIPTKKGWTFSPKLTLAVLGLFTVIGILIIPLFKKSVKDAFPNEKLSIFPFQNLTDNPAFDKIANEVCSWVTRELIESTEANLLSFQSGLLLTNGDLSLFNNNPGLARRNGCINAIIGTYSLWGIHGDSLEFWAQVIDTRTRKPLPLKLQKVYCPLNDPANGFRQLTNVIKGYWKSKKDILLTPPKYDAYEAYLEALLKWAGPKEDEAKPYLLKSIQLDSTFLDPYFLLLDLFYNTNKPKDAFETLTLIRSRFKDLNPRQLNNLRFYEEDISGHRAAAWNYFKKELAYDTMDLQANTSGMIMAMEFLNDPQHVLRLDKSINRDSLDLTNCNYCRTRLLTDIKAYMAISDYDHAGELADKVKLYITRTGEYMTLISYYMAVNDTLSTNHLIAIAASDTSDNAKYKYLINVAGREAMLHRNIPLRNYYADWVIRVSGQGSPGHLARSYFLKEEFETALQWYLKAVAEYPDYKFFLGELGLTYARLNMPQKANEIIIALEKMKRSFDYGDIAYLQGRIKANLGETVSAIQYLSKSLEEGQRFRTNVTFQYDPDLMVLNSNPEYQALLIKNRETK